MNALKIPISQIKGVGTKKEAKLNAMGIYHVLDLIQIMPNKYEDRRKIHLFSEVDDGVKASFCAKIVNIEKSYSSSSSYKKKIKKMSKIYVADESRRAELIFFGQVYFDKFTIGDDILIYGQISKNYGKISFVHPQIIIDTSLNRDDFLRQVPVYSLCEGISQKDMRKFIKNALEIAYPKIVDDIEHINQYHISENLPKFIVDKHHLISKMEAIITIHNPSSDLDLKNAKNRLKFEELFEFQLALFAIKKNWQTALHKPMQYSLIIKEKINLFIHSLPFGLTNAQQKAFDDIMNDMCSKTGMNRVVQGDVGSGKTMVAILSILFVVLNNSQAVMMVPTEILATQHYNTISNLLEPLGICVKLLIGNIKKAHRESILAGCKDGSVHVVIGTHALIQKNVEFKQLNLVITDEQHRFGVRQRSELIAKTKLPNILVMSATPIPRTLSLIIYGDVDVSIIDELPSGRRSIKTHYISSKKKQSMYQFIDKEIQKGRQVYFVCSLIEDSDEINSVSAYTLYEKLSTNVFKHRKVALLHGKMTSFEKDDIMQNFAHGNIDILVSTTVIEVGVDVSNASIMVVPNSERFGLSQLHQLRGRVGRGKHQSYCFLMADELSELAKKRISILVKYSDGFIIADKDWELRGSGDIFGIRQHGLPDMKFADIKRDADILSMASEAVKDCVNRADTDMDVECREYICKIKDKFITEFSI